MRVLQPLVLILLAACTTAPVSAPIPAPVAAPIAVSTPERTPLLNGKDLSGWHGQRHFDPYKLAAMDAAERAKLRSEDDATLTHWRVLQGDLVNDGEGAYLTTDRDYGDIDLQLEYQTLALADSGIYLRGTPQVQIWDTTEKGGKWNLGSDKGSGGLWNNEDKGAWNGLHNSRFPSLLKDLPFGEWNRLRIQQVGERTSVWLNGTCIVDWVVMENFWNRELPLRARGPIQLQTHGGEIRFRNLMLRELNVAEANQILTSHCGEDFAVIFDGKSLAGWQGDKDSYEVEDEAIRCRKDRGGNLFTDASYMDFTVRLQFRLPPGGNNGLAIHYPGKGDAAYDAVEVQVLDDGDPKYADLKPYQAHGSLYALVPAHRGYLRAQGEWNYQEVMVRGTRITVTLNGTTITDADSAKAAPIGGQPHPGQSRKEGFFGFCGHNDPVEFRALAIRKQ